MVRKEIIDKFKSLYKEKFDVQLNDEEATEMATNLVNLIATILKPEVKKDEAGGAVTKYL